MRWCVLVLCLLAPAASATTVPPMDAAQLRAAADVVVEGEVTGTETRLVGRRIITFVTVVSGAPPALTVTLVAVPGGTVGDLAQVVPGAPALEPGRRYRLYLGRADGPRLDGQGPRARGVIGFWRGAFLLDDLGRAIPLMANGQPPLVPSAPAMPSTDVAPTPPESPTVTP